ncbi:hypothetical protein TRVA0_101S00144 [Trichomonascus vanleenenianus]|uniref:uncharacterized protein n=1 Tax=Trichomonascus vanleenenianus TaxID=2268995 RepID=UPI003ECB0537
MLFFSHESSNLKSLIFAELLTMPQDSVTEADMPSKPRQRASFVCRKCHRLKMKCDITTHGIPCSRCKKSGESPCELFPSKRRSSLDVVESLISISRSNRLSRAESCNSPVNSTMQDQGAKETEHIVNKGNTSEGCNTFPANDSSNNTLQEASETTPCFLLDSLLPRLDQMDCFSPFDTSHTAIPIDSQTIGSGRDISSDEPASKSRTAFRQPARQLSAYKRDAESLGFNINMTPHLHEKINRQRLTFLGESCPLSVLLRRLHDSGHASITTNVTDLPALSPKANPGDSSAGIYSYASNENFLTTNNTARKLENGALDKLLRAYFHIVHPFNPIINRRWFAQEYDSQTAPPALLNAMCFAACYHCDSSALYDAGFSCRHEAKKAFYEDTKRLFDEDQDPDLVILLQVALLLSFHGGKPRRVWNGRSWLAVAVNIAEDLGMHRSTMNSRVDELDKRHLRIIWWCMVMRDITTSITLGRPHKICDLRCDVDLLTIEDFEEVDRDPDNTDLFGKADTAYYHLLIGVCKGNILMWKVLGSRYDPRSDPRYNPSEYSKELLDLRKSLPECVDWSKRPTSLPALYMAMVYHHLMIYISRPRMIDSEILEVCSMEQSVRSANEIVSQVAKLAANEILAIPQDVYPLFVTAMAILIADYRSNHSVGSKLQLQICMMTLNQARDNWDHAVWLRSLFERMLEENETSGTNSKDHQHCISQCPHAFFEQPTNNNGMSNTIYNFGDDIGLVSLITPR